MASYITRRLLWTVLLLFVISAIVFIVFYVLPGADPAKLRAGRQQTPEQVEAIRHQLGLDRPKIEQWWDYMKGVFTEFDFGRSFANDVDVREQLVAKIPNTIILVMGAAVIWFLAGVAVGIISAVFRGRVWDRLFMGAALVAISAPVYWLGLVALYLFAEDIGRFPLLPGSGATQLNEGFLDKAYGFVMPWIVLSTAFAAIYARLLRSNLLETLSEDYIRTARAKGVSERRVVMRHGVRSAITPLVTVLGLDIGILMGGAILTETVFNIDGVGRFAFDAIQRGDLQIIQGATLFLAFGVAIMSLVVDILYAFLDPRVRYT